MRPGERIFGSTVTRCAIPSTRSDWQTSRRRHARPSASCGAPPRNIYRNARPQSGEGVGQKTRRSFRNRASKTETHIARNCICVRWCVRIFFAFSHCGTATHFAYLRDGRISKIGKSDFRLTTCRSTLRKREDDQASCFARTNSYYRIAKTIRFSYEEVLAALRPQNPLNQLRSRARGSSAHRLSTSGAVESADALFRLIRNRQRSKI